MLVYREQRRRVQSREALRSLSVTASNTAGAYENLQELLIECGELEAAAVDAGAPPDPLRAVTDAAGEALVEAWRSADPETCLAELRCALARVPELPSSLDVPVSEGYAYYGLYPETYIQAAERFVDDFTTGLATVIGIRSIGTSLSSVVAAVLRRAGWQVHSTTVRPQGHPFERRLGLTPDLLRFPQGVFLSVDEGPGISGSSLCSVAEALQRGGIPDERIVFFPSWNPDADALRSAEARSRWPRHRKYLGSFERQWLDSGRLRFEGGTDLSAGAWRRIVDAGQDSPQVQPQQEARKYLVDGVLWKFVGLGRYGRQKLAHTQVLAESGVVGNHGELRHGFLGTAFLPGRTLDRQDVSLPLIDALAGYVAHRQARLEADVHVDADALTAMVEVNVRELLGESWLTPLGSLNSFHRLLASSPACYVDGRMLPQEWLETSAGYRKVDAVDHGDNHFFPGPVDIAWDVAGTFSEFRFETHARHHFLDRYEASTGDTAMRRRLPYFMVAYLAFRGGYAAMNSEAQIPETERASFAAAASRYRAALEREILRMAVEVQKTVEVRKTG